MNFSVYFCYIEVNLINTTKFSNIKHVDYRSFKKLNNSGISASITYIILIISFIS